MGSTEGVLVVLAVLCVGVSLTQSYDKHVLMDLCQYIGVRYVRNPDNPECGYIACWDRHPYHMPCAPGLQVHPLFFWGNSYPCTEKDTKDKCNYFKSFLQSGNSLGYPSNQGQNEARRYSAQQPQQANVYKPVQRNQNPGRGSYSVNVVQQTEPQQTPEVATAKQETPTTIEQGTPNNTYVTPGV